MPGLLPWFFVALAVGALVTGIYLFWESLRAALGATDPLEVQATAEADARRRLLERKEALLANLRDLKFDYDGGKISPTDFEVLDAKLRSQAKEVLRLLDEDVAPFRGRAEALISERLVAAGRDPYRAAPPVSPDSEPPPAESKADAEGPKADAESPTPDAESPTADADADSDSDEAERLECSSCETLNEPDAVFCKKCGTRVGESAEGEEAGEGA